MTFENEYSRAYDLLYKDKSYKSESKFVINLIKKYNPLANSIIDFGCGSGQHSILMTNEGYDVLGVDLSSYMIKKAEENMNVKHEFGLRKLAFVQGDIRSFQPSKKYDVIIALFHVLSYQTTDTDIVQMLKNVGSCLNDGGIFIFDYWYGPAVLAIKPSTRVKRIEDEGIKITRVAEPELDIKNNIVKVHYDIFVEDIETQKIRYFNEIHPMRYFFEKEVNDFIFNSGMSVLETGEWLTEVELSLNSWSAYKVVKK